MGALAGNAELLIALARVGKTQRLKNTVVPTPLATFLYIYTHASYECYVDYMAGAKLLASYLSPIDIRDAPVRLPDVLASYELTELARALVPYTTIPHTNNLTQIENAIYAYFTQLR